MTFEEMTAPWSYSRLQKFEECPAKYNALMLSKTHKEEKSAAQTDGIDMHDAIEKRLIHNRPLPLSWRHLEPQLVKFDTAEGTKYGEQKLAINNKFQLVGYFDRDVWLRTIVDFTLLRPDLGTALVIDWKSGKRISGDFTQQRLCGWTLFIAMPELHTLRLGYYWTTHRKMTHEVMRRDDIPALLHEMYPRLKRYEEAHRARAWPIRQNNFCAGCPMKECQHYKERKTR